MAEEGELSSGVDGEQRRGFLKAASSAAMVGGLAASYGTFAVMAGRFVFPAADSRVAWQYVARLDQMQAGQSMAYTTPTGAKVVVARQGDGDTVDDFIALSSVCPHLGCQVHWEAANQRFFCPCHNGAFDPQGRPTEGPPATAGQALSRFPLKIEAGLLYIEVPLDSVSLGQSQRETV